MRALRVLAVCGSLQADSSHLLYLRGLCNRHVPGVEILLSDHLRHLALFNPDLLEAEPGSTSAPGSNAASLAAWRRALAGCAALKQVLMAVDAHVVWEGPMISGEEVDARSQDMLRTLQRSVETHG